MRGDERDVARLSWTPTAGRSRCADRSGNAASSGRTLDGALERWQRASGSLIKEFVDAALADQEPMLAARARRLFDGEPVDEAALDRLEARGMFVQLATACAGRTA